MVVSQSPDLGPACAAALLSGGATVSLIGAGTVPDGVDRVGVEDGWTGASVEQDLELAAEAQGQTEVLVVVPPPGVGRALARTGDGHFATEQRALTTAFGAVRHAVPPMVTARWGRVVLVSGVVALYGGAWETAHGAALAGIVGLARSLAREVAAAAVTVNVVAPGMIASAHLDQVRSSGARAADAIDSAVAGSPLRRLGTAAEVAHAVAYLASDAAAYLTGVVLPVDGGLAMGVS